MGRERIVVVSSADTQPRYHRRVEMFLDAGCEVTVYTFRRSYYRVNRYPSGAEVVELGDVENGRYWSRLPAILRALRIVRRFERERAARADVMYCFGFDSALLGLLVGHARTRIIYEIGDLRGLHFESSARGAAFRRCEAAVLRRAAAFIITAPAMLHEYYAKVHPDTSWKGVVVENRLPGKHFTPGSRGERVEQRRGRIRIGVIGFLRYPGSLYPLLRSVAGRAQSFELHVFGDGPLRPEVERAASDHENITYHGAFKNPSDLAAIYARIDVNYVVYDSSDHNVRLALPNKLYESIFFGVPMMVAAETALADRVLGSGVGAAVDPRDDRSVGAALDDLDEIGLAAMSERARALPASELVEDGAVVFGEIMRSLDGDRNVYGELDRSHS